MSDLVEFLTARLDEDELAAHEAFGMPINPAGQAVEHYARHDPARVLREVAAKRLALEEVTYWEGRVEAGAVYADRPANRVQQLADEAQGVAHRFEATQAILRALATAYSDHPGYQEAWRV